jgi:calcineurin-like phosphoesterase family protein
MQTYYLSDPHFLHANIIRYAQRPFLTAAGEPDVAAQDQQLMQAIRAVCRADTRLVCAGDWTFNVGRFLQHFPDGLPNAARNVLVVGNHDKGFSEARTVRRMAGYFGTIIGTSATWTTNHVVVDDWLDGRAVQVLVSHLPQRLQRRQGADYNVYGHVHRNHSKPADDPELAAYYARTGREADDERWAITSPRHLCACVEVTDFRPVTLAELVARKSVVV